MRPYIRKLIICFVPVLLSLWAIWYAREHDQFKLGVDLSGGTILVYEIKQNPDEQRRAGDLTAKEQTALLAEKLKHRIDPNDLYNIIVRPAGEGRVEIILPTGGPERAEKAEKAWVALRHEMEKKYGLPKDTPELKDVNRGRIQELAERIQHLVNEGKWSEHLFKGPEALKALEAWANTDLTPLRKLRNLEKIATAAGGGVGAAAAGPVPGLTLMLSSQKLYAPAPLVQGDGKRAEAKPLSSVRELIVAVKRRVNDYGKEREIENWFKQQAWSAMIAKMFEQGKTLEEKAKAEKKDYPSLGRWKALADDNPDDARYFKIVRDIFTRWPALSDAEKEALLEAKRQEEKKQPSFVTIAPDSFEELIGRAEVGGSEFAQGVLSALEPAVGNDVTKGDKRFLQRTELADFIHTNYGYTLKEIQEAIEKDNKESRRGRDLTAEEIQRIKERVSKVGSLEFVVLANSYDDADAIGLAKIQIESGAWDTKLKENQEKGQPPPPPTSDGSPNAAKAKVFELTKLPRGYKSKVTYRWVELGQQERQSLKLNNNAKNEGDAFRWSEMQAAIAGRKAIQLRESRQSKQMLMQGALFYGRPCEDRNLTEEERRKKQFEYFVLVRNPEIDPETNKEMPRITGDYLKNAHSSLAEARPTVSFEFGPEGARLFSNLTKKNIPSEGSGDASTGVKRYLAIILEQLVQSAATINSEISSHGQISGNFTQKDVNALVDILRSGKLPATLNPQPVSESTLGATLGRDTIEDGIRAIAIAFVAVVVFMILYYRFAGMVASVALLVNLILLVGFMVWAHATFTLPGLAGIVLTMGMAVDANVLIYERLREEKERGASLVLALRNGYDRAFPTIIDTHLSSIFTAIVLYAVGNDQLKGFGISLTVGLIISLFTSLYVTRVLFDLWQHQGWLKKLSMFKLFSKPDIDFMAIRYYWFTATIVLTILGMAMFIGRGENGLNIDFIGGTAYAGKLNQGTNITELRKLLDEKRQHEMLRVKKVEEVEAGGNQYRIVYELPGGGLNEWTVTLANPPQPRSEERDSQATRDKKQKEREEKVKERAETVPDLSVEQIFAATAGANDVIKKEQAEGKSRLFNVRSSEKEPELVQAALDQLLREPVKEEGKEAWRSLLDRVKMKIDTELTEGRRDAQLSFFKATDTVKGADAKAEPVFASPSFVRTLLSRELLSLYRRQAKSEGRADAYKELSELPFIIEITGIGPTDQGRFREMKVTFTPSSGAGLKGEDVALINQALRDTAHEFEQRPQPERLENFDSALAADTRLRAMYAILLSWGAILVYLWFRFGNWTFGLATVLCLMHDLFFTLGIIAACHYLHQWWPGFLGVEDFKIDLTAVAALLTLVGYSVNDTIVVFDRIREVRGKNPDLTPQMINDSVNQTLSRTLLTAFTVWLVVFVIYAWGGPGLHLFSFVMLVGVIVGTYSSIYIASPLLLIFGEGARSVKAGQARPGQPAGAVETGIQTAR